MSEMTIEKLAAFCRQYGFIYQGSEIYGGLANTWDYGPLGARLKNNFKGWSETPNSSDENALAKLDEVLKQIGG